MKIALIAPSPIPFMSGGAEKLLLGLHYFADKLSGHQVELIKVPIREHSFWDILDAYKTFYDLDLSHFDAVLSQKYPAWMTRHPRRRVYMLHRLRGLYDTYPGHYPAYVDAGGSAELTALLRYVETHPPSAPEIDGLFDLLRPLRAAGLPPSLFDLPGPLIRLLVHFMDDWALHPDKVERYAAISHVVKNRPGYFPDPSVVDTVYPASALEGLTPSPLGDYLFTASRLDYAKRLDLIITAFKQSRTRRSLLIAGAGPARSELEAMAGGDPRIRFIGYVSNDALAGYYRDCYGVIYAPKEEDYGYITVEAMQCAKSVLTCSDSGAVLEFVKDGETGLVAEPTPDRLAKAIDRFCRDASAAEAMGQRAFEKVKNCTWSNVMNQVLPLEQPRPKVLALSTYEVFPRQHGGQLRVYNIHKSLAKAFQPTIFAIDIFGENLARPREAMAHGVRQLSLTISPKHKQRLKRLSMTYPVPIEDIFMAELVQYSPLIMDRFQEEYAKADIIFLEHPYLAQLLPAHTDKPVIYNAHNVEFLLKAPMLGGKAAPMLEKVKALEQLACDRASLILACSQEDKDHFTALYGADPQKILLLPNGFDCSAITPAYTADRVANRVRLNIQGAKIAVFIGSYHKPNIEAVEHIFSLAREMPEVSFLVMGGVGNAFKDIDIPVNVAVTGRVQDPVRDAVYRVAGVAINPMSSGSGTNLKLAEYTCYGLPVVTTPIGARGYGLEDGKTAFISSLDDFPAQVRRALDGGRDIDAMELAAEKYIRAHFDWPVMVERVLPDLLGTLN